MIVLVDPLGVCWPHDAAHSTSIVAVFVLQVSVSGTVAHGQRKLAATASVSQWTAVPSHNSSFAPMLMVQTIITATDGELISKK